MVFPGGVNGKESICQCRRLRDEGLIPGSGRSPGGGHGHPLQYSCLENPVDTGAWRATVHGAAETEVTWYSCTKHCHPPPHHVFHHLPSNAHTAHWHVTSTRGSTCSLLCSPLRTQSLKHPWHAVQSLNGVMNESAHYIQGERPLQVPDT